MSYLLDKKTRRNKFLKLAISAIALILLIYFHSGIFYGLSSVAHTIFRPVLALGNNIGGKFGVLGSFFAGKKLLYLENEKLKAEIEVARGRISNYNTLAVENNQLKEILGRKGETNTLVLGSILSKPNQSPYDTLVIDVGANKGIKTGDMVFAAGDIPVGRVDLVYGSSAKVILFSSPGEKTEAVVVLETATEANIDLAADGILPEVRQVGKNIFVEVVGRGGGNFEMSLPRDLTLERGREVTLPGINPYVLGIIEEVISDPRDSFQKVLLTSPVNMQELKFVEIEIESDF